jgi:hypothetical protein
LLQIQSNPTNEEEASQSVNEQEMKEIDNKLTSNKSKEIEEDMYRKVCENIHHNLSLIRSYAKRTLIPDAKAVYLSIVDAALTGPHQLDKHEAVAVLGVSYVIHCLFYLVHLVTG